MQDSEKQGARSEEQQQIGQIGPERGGQGAGGQHVVGAALSAEDHGHRPWETTGDGVRAGTEVGQREADEGPSEIRDHQA